MTILVEVLPALAAVLVAALVVRALTQGRARRRALEAPWRPRTRSAAPHQLVVEVARPGEEPQPIATLDPAADDFDDLLHQANARAANVAAALNAGRR